MRVLVTGARDWTDRASVWRWLDACAEVTAVIEGEARGADTFAREWGHARGVKVLAFPAQWKLYGKGAGPVRNAQMLAEGKPDVVVFFHDDLSTSKGTLDMVTRARRAGVPVFDGMAQIAGGRDGDR
jgi:hypothetical protein